MSFFYKPPKNARSYITFFILVYLTCFILYCIGYFITNLVIVALYYSNVSETINFFSVQFSTIEFWKEFFTPLVFSIPIILVGGFICYGLDLATQGAKIMTRLYILFASGRIGKIVGLIPLFDFEGEWVVEHEAKEEINLSTGRGMYKELVLERGNDVLLFSSLVGSFLLVVLQKFSLVSLNPTSFHTVFNIPINDGDFFAIFTGFLTIFILCLYIPSMWIFKDGKVKKIVFTKQKAGKNVTNISDTYRQGLGVFIGFSAIIGIAGIAVDWVTSQPGTTISSSTITGSIIGYVAIYIYAFAFLLYMGSIILPGICLTMIRYMRKHEEFILNTRHDLIKKGKARSGSIQFTETSILREIQKSLALLHKEETHQEEHKEISS